MISSLFTDRIAEIEREVEKNKVELTPEIKAYLEKHIRKLRGKLTQEKSIFESDLDFFEFVKEWILMREEYRKKFPSIKGMLESQDMEEAKKRNISIEQWLDLLRVAGQIGETQDWIDQQFQFPGNGKIQCGFLGLISTSVSSLPSGLRVESYLFLSKCESLTSLSPDLHVGRDLELSGCTSLASLPSRVSVGGYLNLINCTSLISISSGLSVEGSIFLRDCSSLISLPSDLRVRKDLDMTDCRSLTTLPSRLSVRESFSLYGCLSLTSLPSDISVEGDLILSDNVQQKVKDDAIRLKAEGKIKGKIEYI